MPRKGQHGAGTGHGHGSGWRTGGSRILANPDTAAAEVRPGVCLDAELYADLVIVLKELDQLLQYLPEQKIREFAKSETFGHYKRLLERVLNLPVEGPPYPGGEGGTP